MTDSFEITTERLGLRRFTLDDAGLMLAIWNDPAFVRFVGDRGVRSIEDAKNALTDSVLRLYAEYGYGPFRVALKAGDIPIGICGLFRREGLEDPDVGFALLPDYCGKGCAFEAARAVIEHARDELGLERLTAIVSADNVASIRLIQKLGLTFERVLHLPGDDDVDLYAMRLRD